APGRIARRRPELLDFRDAIGVVSYARIRARGMNTPALQAAGLTVRDRGMEALQCTPVGNSSSLAVPPNMSPAIRSMRVRPNPKWVGDFTVGPPLSRQLSRTDFGTTSHWITIFPAGTESAPYFEALVASSCRMIPNDWAA